MTSQPTWFAADYDSTYSIAWGDVDGDGDLDLAAGNSDYPNTVYLNEGGVLQSNAAWSSAEINNTQSVAWGDMDGDGDLDLATGNDNNPNGVYLNEDGVLQSNAIWSSADVHRTQSIAWGDVDGDGDLDLAAGNSDYPNSMYLNVDGMLQNSAAWSSDNGHNSRSVAWGDMDGDGDLDLAVGNEIYPNEVYLNVDGVLQSSAAWSSADYDVTYSIAWGDVDQDGDLDLAAGNWYVPNKVYLNEGGMLQSSAAWSSNDPGLLRTTALAWGDVDQDGDLDLAAGNLDGPSQVYLNENGALQSMASWFSPENDFTSSLAWGDMDGDGDLDLAVGNDDGPNKVYVNDGMVWPPTSEWFSADTDLTASIVWGDMDGDGDLDLAAGNTGSPSKVYLNEGGMLQSNAVWSSADSDGTDSIAWGDVDGDGDLDLAVGNAGNQNKVYRNEDGLLQDSAYWLSNESDHTWSIAWGDMDGDGDLDLAAGNQDTPNRVYRNENGDLQTSADWSSDDINDTQAIAWGDMDGDGDLDLVAGGSLNKIYLNVGGVLQTTPSWSSRKNDLTRSIALGDVDGDGDLDLATGNWYVPNLLYLNEGGLLQSNAAWSSSDSDDTESIALGDVDGDGDLDLVAGNSDGLNKVYLNVGGMLQKTASWHSRDSDANIAIALGDVDGGGSLEMAVGKWGRVNDVYLNLGSAHPLYTNARAGVAITLHSDPVQTFRQDVTTLAPANFYAIPGIRQAGTIPFTYYLFQPLGESVRSVRAYYSLNGGGKWHEAVAAPATVTTNLETRPYLEISAANTHVYVWDTFASGFFGQSDNVVFRLVALPNLRPIPNRVPGPFLYPYVSTQSYPFRVRGTQVRVVDENHVPVPQAVVYRLLAGNVANGQLMGSNGTPFRTSNQGYLAGRGALQSGDQLLALAPVASGAKYTLYQTSGQAMAGGVDGYPVTQGGVQGLRVSAANPLLLFDLDVSLEWDASQDAAFLSQLQQDLRAASAALYDWSNGQVALGAVKVYQNREQWETADIRLYASNQVRPVANRGGVVSDTLILADPRLSQPITATHGEIRIGTVWSRYGDASNVGSDWPNVLAHELSHYLLFLEDSYLGLDAETGLLVPVTTCTGTAMTDPYLPEASEFRADESTWQQECSQSLAELPDWELIKLAYPALQSPPPENVGPSTMPFAFTTIEMVPPPVADPPLLSDGYVDLGEAGDSVANGRVYLVKADRLVDLGRPLVNAVQAYGAQEGDELCVFGRSHFTCSLLSNEQSASFTAKPLWNPDLSITPINTTTVRLRLDGTPGVVTLYPNGANPQSVNLTAGVEQVVTLNEPSVEVWVDVRGPNADERLMSSYNIGAGPGRIKSHAGPGRIKSHAGPITTGDGAVTLYPPKALPSSVFMVVQTAAVLPPLPAGLTPIGRGYRIQPSGSVSSYDEASLTFQYLGMELVLAGVPESGLAIYYWDGTVWQRLETVLNRTQNFASAAMPGAGLYVLLSSHVLPLGQAGWNLVGYSIEERRSIEAGLASIAGQYTTVYGYEPGDEQDPWKVYAVGVPGWVNDLSELAYGKGYWIYATQPVTLYLEGVPLVEAGVASSLPTPPATFYGEVAGGESFVPVAGMAVVARIGDEVCGRGETLALAGQVLYQVDVSSVSEAAGCGDVGQAVSFTVDGLEIATQGSWTNEGVQQFDLLPALIPNSPILYLPFIPQE